MDVSGMTKKLEGLFYDNSEIIGVGAGALAYGLDPIIENVQEILAGNAGMPDLAVTIKEFLDPKASAGAKNFEAIKWYAIGWGLKEIGIGGRLGGAIQNVAKGFVVGNGIQHVLHSAVHNHT